MLARGKNSVLVAYITYCAGGRNDLQHMSRILIRGRNNVLGACVFYRGQDNVLGACVFYHEQEQRTRASAHAYFTIGRNNVLDMLRGVSSPPLYLASENNVSSDVLYVVAGQV